ncbi:MAG: ATP-binding protein [bacterium]
MPAVQSKARSATAWNANSKIESKLGSKPASDIDALRFSDLKPRDSSKDTAAEEKDSRSLPEKLAREVVAFERHPAKKLLGIVAPLVGAALSFSAILDKNSSKDKQILGFALGLPLILINLLYKEVVNPAAKKLIPEKYSKTDFNPDKDMIFPSAEFKEILFNGVSRFLDASDRSGIELKLNHRNQKSPTMLFTGPPGVGKTEIAKFVAEKMGRELKFVTSEQDSKYWGETENNLIKLFEEAKKKNQLLFFDEADTFLSQRSDAAGSFNSSSVQARNSIVNTILKQIDESGVPVILATNSGEIDGAIKSRMKVTIAFPPATPEQNYGILLSQFKKMEMKPERLAEFEKNKTPLLELFSKFEFSPRHVNNIVDDAVQLLVQRVSKARRAGADALAKADKSINLEDVKTAILRLKENLEKSSKSQMGGRSPLLKALGV